MRISLLQCFLVDTSAGPRMETAADPIWLIGTTFQPRGSHPFSAKITFPFSQAGHVTHRGKEASPQRASLPFHSSPSSYPARVPGHFPAHLRASYEESKSQWRRGWRFRYEFPAFRYAAAPISNISSSRNEEFRPQNSPSHTRLPYLPDFPFTRRRKWGSRWYFT